MAQPSTSKSKEKDDPVKNCEDELVSYDFRHMLVGPDTKVENTEYACYCGRFYNCRRMFKDHLKRRNIDALVHNSADREGVADTRRRAGH